MINQLVALIVGCILFFRGISYFMNQSLAGINNVQIAQSGSFATQSYSRCSQYLSGAEAYFQEHDVLNVPLGDCFATDVTTSPQPVPMWKIRLYHLREKVRTIIQ